VWGHGLWTRLNAEPGGLWRTAPLQLHVRGLQRYASAKPLNSLGYWQVRLGSIVSLHNHVHWLDVPERIKYKLNVTVWSRRPSTTMLSQSTTPYCATCYRLNTFGRLRAFSVAGPNSWSSLSDRLRDPTPSSDSFRGNSTQKNGIILRVLKLTKRSRKCFMILHCIKSRLTLTLTSGGSKNFEKEAEDNLSVLVLIYRKCAQRSIGLLHGKGGFLEKIWANRGRAAAPTASPPLNPSLTLTENWHRV